jgi:cytochrome c biogenesis protein
MRTALILLFLLAVAAVPGSLLPQRPLNPDKTTAYLKTHGAWGHLLDHLGFFDVFGSVWFAAIYLLLFVSLVGCLIPRIRLHAKAVARKPLPAPRNLSKLPEAATFTTSASAEEYAAAARRTLGRRWRVVTRTEESGAIAVSAEKGYSRETGNLIFHVALLVSLVLIAVGRLYSYQGTRIVSQGADQGFCNTVSQYDSWKPGRFAAEGKISPAPFCLDVSKFVATYTSDGEASEFLADVTYTKPHSTAPINTKITVNHPLRLDGDRVYLIGHGFSPEITVRKPDGTIWHSGPTSFVPENAQTFLSDGVFKIPGKPGANQDVGLSGFFAPTPLETSPGIFTSSSPQVNNPMLGIVVWEGNLNLDGLPQNVYTLDTSKMKQLGMSNLLVGQTQTFKNGISVTFDGWVPWVSLQVSHDPSQGYLLFSALAMVIGLLGSLGIRRRRIWLRVTPSGEVSGGSPTVVSVGGLARSDSGNFTTEFAALTKRLEGAVSTSETE